MQKGQIIIISITVLAVVALVANFVSGKKKATPENTGSAESTAEELFFLPDTKGAQIHECITPLPGDVVIQKHYPNSFRETDLYDHLTGAGIKEVVICGAMSHMCIDATTRAAADFGFSCVVVHDGCATRDLEFGGKTIPAGDVHGSFMSALAMGYARVLDFKDFLKYAEKL